MTARKNGTAIIVAVAALSITLPSVAWGQVDYHLEPGENSRDWVFTGEALNRGTVTDESRPLVLDVSLSPNCRSGFVIHVDETADLYDPDNEPQLVGMHVGPRYRQVLLEPRPYHFRVGGHERRPQPPGTPHIRECEITVRLFRPDNMCIMSAEVTGDIYSRYFGDIAYFNFFPKGAPITTGNAMDPATAQLVDQLPGMEAGGWEQAMREWAAEDDDPPATVGDKFGLTMLDIVQGSSGLAGSPESYERSPDFLESMEAAMTSLSGFSLTASAPGDELTAYFASPDGEVEIPPPLVWPGTRTVQLSRVDLLPGGVMDANLAGVKFVYEQGGPGSATLRLASPFPNVVYGFLRGQLLSAKRYEQGRLSVEVVATFQARRGALSCQR